VSGVLARTVGVILVLQLALTGAAAQGINFAGGGSDVPTEVFADDGIEWDQDRKVFTARGSARAVRGEVQIFADTLRAFYLEKEGGGTDIRRLEAEGQVRIQSPGETAYGDFGVYEMGQAVLVLTSKPGKRVKLVTAEDEVTADRQLEYWEAKQLAVARGNAVAVREGKRLHADILTAHFGRDKNGKSRIHRVEAFDGVSITTEDDVVSSDRAVYNVNSGIVTLSGSVKITRGANQLNGCEAEVNLNTGKSQLKSCSSAISGGNRVQGLLKAGKARKKIRKKE
jgi:lipopolysaccharide export system protein LptA